MATSIYFSQKVKSEQNLYEDIIIESLRTYGQDIFYLPREVINKDPVLADDVPSKFNSSYKIEMYIENVEGYDGGGDIFSKFGVELRDAATFIVSRKRWRQTVLRYDNVITGERPREGDLLYIPLTRSMFEIMHVEHEQPFYQLSNLPTYKLRCEKFEYNDEDFDTGVIDIDDIETSGFEQILSLQDSASTGFVIGSNITQVLGGLTITAEITAFNDSDNTMSVTHIGSNEPGLHLVNLGRIVSVDSNGNIITRTVLSTNEQLNQAGAQNEDFDIDTNTIIDWSENNPFGDPENV